VAASDAFFPFADGLQVLLDGGVRARRRAAGRLGPRRGGLAAARDAGIALYTTGTRHFAH
jgi:phosphoribosylaminoimidazolecarboxamide formyltransferase/IMP cyclohydrolase